MSRLPVPPPGRRAAVAFVDEFLRGLCDPTEPETFGSPVIHGGQEAADRALQSLRLVDHDRRQSEVYPQPRRGATGLSPYVRHGLLSLPEVWAATEGPAAAGAGRDDVETFRTSLLSQEYARHWYARLGTATRRGVRRDYVDRVGDRRPATEAGATGAGRPWPDDMACMELTLDELTEDGWLPNQARLWLASQWTVRHGRHWREGEDFFFRHLLDGSRAANRQGWQWVAGLASRRPYGFSRWQVEKWAAGLCATCERALDCPVEDWPETADRPVSDVVPEPAPTGPGFGPTEVTALGTPSTVWLTAESLGHRDPALAANPGLPAVFVFDAPLLRRLRLSSKRLVFLVETLAELARDRPLELRIGAPVTELADRAVAVTHAPVPGYVQRARAIRPVEVHPWPWLVAPDGASIRSYSAWRATSTASPLPTPVRLASNR